MISTQQQANVELFVLSWTQWCQQILIIYRKHNNVSTVSGYSEYRAQPGLSHSAWGPPDQRQDKEGSEWADGAESEDLCTGKRAEV